MSDEKHPFVPKEDRPEVKIDPSTPIGQLTVRDLQAILGSRGAVKKIENKDTIKDQIKVEVKDQKPEYKEFKHEYKEFKNELKEHKIEKLEQKAEVHKLEVPDKLIFEPIPDPTIGIDPATGGIARIAEEIAGLTKRVDQLANQVAELEKRIK